MKSKKAPIIAIAILVMLGVALAILTSGSLIAQQSVPSNGNVGGQVSSTVDIGVYTDTAATKNCLKISWGNLNPGSAVTQTVYIKNTGSQTEKLTLTSSGWNPASASLFLTLTWGKEGITLSPGAVIPAILTLTVAAQTGILTNFNFNILISGTT